MSFSEPKHIVLDVGVILRAKVNNHSYVLLVYQKESKYYGFPKGKIESADLNEKGRPVFRKTAVRELADETSVIFTENELENCSTLKVRSHHYFLKDIDEMPEISYSDIKDASEIGGLIWLDIDSIDLMKEIGAQKFTIEGAIGNTPELMQFAPITWKVMCAMRACNDLDNVFQTKQKWNPFHIEGYVPHRHMQLSKSRGAPC